ncbi:hypothetical protein AAC387_Pa03g3623 [Persea americana]
MNSMRMQAFWLMGFFLLALLYLGSAQSMTPSPAPDAPISDAKDIDQGIAYALLLIALTITYLIH